MQLRDPCWSAWWDEVWFGDGRQFDDQAWHANFRMCRQSFEILLEKCRGIPAMRAQDTNMRSAIPLEKRLACALWRFANGVCSVRQIRAQFGVGRKTAWKFFWDFAEATETRLQHEYIYFPETAAGIEALRAEFEARSGGYPCAIAAMDGSEVLVPDTELFNRDYQNRKFQASIKCLSLCDARTRHLAVDISQAGSVNDADAWSQSPIKTDLEQRLKPQLYAMAREVGVEGHMQRVPLHLSLIHI
eukprot:TRINITY_DN2505_c0_g1_i1.p1 TRINITY_DN2505_c0_g1~~TRINITY_DN2505_c0_g1_i1.p1  ORF type:complete len:245 (+),score=57.18 TRINITY_DN2505_c0_g1_i1:216-950(+)